MARPNGMISSNSYALQSNGKSGKYSHQYDYTVKRYNVLKKEYMTVLKTTACQKVIDVLVNNDIVIGRTTLSKKLSEKGFFEKDAILVERVLK